MSHDRRANNSVGVDRFRRVVTGVDATGRSVITSDGAPPVVIHPRHPDQVLTAVWTCAALPADYDAPTDEETFRLEPPPAGLRIIRNRLPPDTTLYVDDDGQPREPGPSEFMHRTRTIDFVQVLDGDLWLLLDSGEEVHLRAGDCVIQRGTVHAWRNHTERATTYLAVLVPADESTLPATPNGPEPIA